MKVINLLITALLFTIPSHAQKSILKIDLQKLVDKENLNITLAGGNKASFKDNNGLIEISVNNLPTLLYLQTIEKNHKVITRKLVWVESNEVSISGSLLSDNLIVRPSVKQQELADKVFMNLKKIDQDSELFTSIPYIVHLTGNLNFVNEEYLKNLMRKIPEETKSFWGTLMIEQYLSELRSVGFNASTKEFKFLVAKNEENKDQEFRQNKDKLLIIDFGASWCTFCIEAIPDLRELHDKYNKKIEILSLWDDRSQETWLKKSSTKKEKINWASLRDDSGAIFKVFNIKSYPTYMVIDSSGRITKTFLGSNKLVKYIEKQM